MKKKNPLLFLLVVADFLLSCNDGSTKAPVAEKNAVDSATAYCYYSIRNRDTVFLHINVAGNKVTGDLEYNLYEKDKNKGSIQGMLKGDTLIAEYTFLSEGIESVREVAFLKKGNDWVEGYGDIEEKNGRVVFKDIKALNFNSGFVLQEKDCKELKSFTNDSPTFTTMSSDLQESLTPIEILQRFKNGNKRFLEGKMLHRDYLKQVDITAAGQHPFAIVLSCIDSRKPTEIIFDKGIGDLFNARIAGNFVNTDILGSIEYACKVSGAKLILVIGHTDCGAIKSACNDVRLGNITALLANIKPAVNSVKGFNNERNSKNAAFVQAVAKENVLLAKAKILKQSSIIKEMVKKNQVIIACGMYSVKTGAVEFYD
jgi:carbonic anhydrase